MIKNIPTIKNLAVFKDFKWDQSVGVIPFEKLNILYGRNYSGKTTLSRLLRAMETGEISDKYDNPIFLVSFDDGTTIDQSQLSSYRKKIRVFNEDFVKDNLGFITNPDETIKPFAVLGENNNVLEKEISVLESELGSNEVGKESGLYAQLKDNKKVYDEMEVAYQQVASSLDKRLNTKATDRKTGIKYNVEEFGDQNYNITKLIADIKEVMSENYTPLRNDEKSEYRQLLSERIKPPIPVLSPARLRWEQFCTETEYLLSKEIGSSGKIAELLRDVALNEWVKSGYELHKEIRETCAFCGSTISDARWEELFRHFDSESKILEDRLNDLLATVQAERESVIHGFTVDKNWFYSRFQSQVEELVQRYSNASVRYIEQLDLIIEQLSTRKRNITASLSFTRPLDFSQELYDVWTSYGKLKNESNEFSKKLNDEQKIVRRQLLLQEVYEFCITINYSEIQLNIDNLKDELAIAKMTLENREAEVNAKTEQLMSKKRQLNDEEQGAIQVNRYLTDHFGHEFLSLRAVQDDEDREKKVRFEVVRDGKPAFHLSEGESSLIAFCYFMAKLGDIDTKGTKPIIWIDDPISSLDGNHIFFVYSLIASQIARRGMFEQLFVSTHNLNFLKYLKRLKGYELKPDGGLKECGKQYFIITRHGQYSTIQKMPRYLKEYGTEFNYLFSCIYKCSRITNVDDTNYELLYNFGNNARKFLEIYLYFKYPDYSNDKLQRFFGDDIPYILLERINNEYSHLNGTVERAAMPVEIPEMVATAKLIIDKIQEDRDQYDALLKSIGVTE